jgi:hypothetical protein
MNPRGVLQFGLVLAIVACVVFLFGCEPEPEDTDAARAREVARLRGCVLASSVDADKLLSQAEAGVISLTGQARERLEMIKARGQSCDEREGR